MPDPISQPGQRDARIDVIRGFALLMIYVDHIPLNALSRYTLRQFSFADAAEVFVLLAGCSAMLGFGGTMEREGLRAGSWRAFRRAAVIYHAQAGLLLATLAIVAIWLHFLPMHDPLFNQAIPTDVAGIARSLALVSVPDYLEVLPLYVVQLTLFPLVYVGIRRHPFIAVTLSGSLWLLAWFDRRLNLPNALDPTGAGWGFAPLSWQFLFVIGAALALALRPAGTLLPMPRWVTVLCWIYLVWAYVLHRWADLLMDWDGVIETGLLDKSHLSPLRLLSVLALVYLLLCSRRVLRWCRLRALRPIEACGRHSLAIYSLGSILALIGRLEFGSFGPSPWLQFGVNLAGLGIMMAVALILEQRAGRPI